MGTKGDSRASGRFEEAPELTEEDERLLDVIFRDIIGRRWRRRTVTVSQAGAAEAAIVWALCALCGQGIEGQLARYPGVVCAGCASTAVDEKGNPATHESSLDAGTNPVWIGRRRCWRRYRFGGFVTMLDLWGSASAHDHVLRAEREPTV